MDEEFLKDVVKFFVLRYVSTLIVSRTVTGKHKQTYIVQGLETVTADVIEKTIDVIRKHRGEYMFIDIILQEVAKELGFRVKLEGGKVVSVNIPIGTAGGKRKRRKYLKIDAENFRRIVTYALSAAREVFDLVELVKRPAREEPERRIADDWQVAVGRRFNEFVNRLNTRIVPLLENAEAYLCPNFNCSVIELYTQEEASENDYTCKGKRVLVLEYSDSARDEELGEEYYKTLQGCGSYLEAVDPEIAQNLARIFNAIVEEISKERAHNEEAFGEDAILEYAFFTFQTAPISVVTIEFHPFVDHVPPNPWESYGG